MAWDFTEDEIVEAIRESNYEAKKAVSILLYGSSAPSKPSKPSSNKTNKPAPAASKPANKPAAKTNNNNTTANEPVKQVPAGNKTQTNKGNPSALAVDLCAPVEAFTPQLNSANSSESTGLDFHFLIFYFLKF